MNYDKLNSLDDFRKAIDLGFDIVFFIDDVKYNISWRDYKPFICICPDGRAVFFEDADALLDGYVIDGKKLKELWDKIDIDFM